MTTLLSQLQKEGIKKSPLSLPKRPKMYRTKYASLPVPIPSDFLSSLPQSSLQTVSVQKLDFARSVLPEYTNHFALIIDGLFDEKECKELIHYAEMSAGGHGHGDGSDVSTFQPLRSKNDPGEEKEERGHDAKKENGWHQALVRAGANREMLSLQHRDSDRIIWSAQEVASKIWERVVQAPGVRKEMEVLEGEKSRLVMGEGAVEREEKWRVSRRGINESLKFLRYGKGQYFREHCDGTYETADGTERSFFTIHLYLNDSVATADPKTEKELISLDLDQPGEEDVSGNPEDEMLEGGATTFHSRDMRFKVDVDPKVGRVLIFQQKGLLHSGADVVKGIKYTMRSDIMYEFDDEDEEGDGDGDERDIVFG